MLENFWFQRNLWSTPRRPRRSLHLEAPGKAKSFVVLDEDVLKVVPAKEQVKVGATDGFVH